MPNLHIMGGSNVATNCSEVNFSDGTVQTTAAVSSIAAVPWVTQTSNYTFQNTDNGSAILSNQASNLVYTMPTPTGTTFLDGYATKHSNAACLRWNELSQFGSLSCRQQLAKLSVCKSSIRQWRTQHAFFSSGRLACKCKNVSSGFSDLDIGATTGIEHHTSNSDSCARSGILHFPNVLHLGVYFWRHSIFWEWRLLLHLWPTARG